MQGAIQKWVDHSISVTVNLPNSVDEALVNNFMLKHGVVDVRDALFIVMVAAQES